MLFFGSARSDVADFRQKVLGDFCYFAGFDAGRAYINFSDAPFFNHCADSLKIGVEPPFIQIVGMADIVANHWFLSANCTLFRHFYTPNENAPSKY